MRKPYIGITGFMTTEEISTIISLIPTKPKQLLMVGVLASLKTLRGIQNKWPNRYPKIKDISTIFTDHCSVLNLIHYNTKEQETLLEQLRILTEIGGVNLGGFQLNIAWPSPAVLEKYRIEFPEMNIVLQIGKHALKIVEHSPEQLFKKVMEYTGIVDYILLDSSGGYGKPLNTKKALEYLSVLRDKKIDISLGVAGGFSKNTLNLVQPLVSEFHNLSIDAEGLLRNDEDHLNLELASAYFQKALEIFSNT